MSQESRKILEMLSNGKINAAQAEQLLDAVYVPRPEKSAAESGGEKTKPKYLIVNVFDGTEQDGQPAKVNVRVPLQMLRAGVKLAAVIPALAKSKINDALNEKGIKLDLENLKPEDLTELVEAMADMTVNVNDGRDRVRVYCE